MMLMVTVACCLFCSFAPKYPVILLVLPDSCLNLTMPSTKGDLCWYGQFVSLGSMLGVTGHHAIV